MTSIADVGLEIKQDEDDESKVNYCISVTYKCNWDCDYCCVDTHNQQEPAEETVLNYARQVKPFSHVSLSGGEPGMIEESLLIKLLDIFEEKKCVIGVNTNGMFWIKYSQYADRIDDYRYHCSLDLKNKVWKPPGHENMNIKYLIVVTDKNYPLLDSFLTKNEDIPIVVYSADEAIVHGKPGTKLSAGNRIKLYQNFKHRIRMDNIDYLFSRNIRTNNCKPKKLIRLNDRHQKKI